MGVVPRAYGPGKHMGLANRGPRTPIDKARSRAINRGYALVLAKDITQGPSPMTYTIVLRLNK